MGCPATAPILNDAHYLEIGLDGRLHIADKFSPRIVAMGPDTLEVADVLGKGALLGVLVDGRPGLRRQYV